MPPDSRGFRLGMMSAIAAHLLWGVFPLFWRELRSVHPLEVVSHRVIWASGIILLGLPIILRLLGNSERKRVAQTLLQKKFVATYVLAGVLIGTNWLTFIWAVSNNRVLEASLGYFISPLLSVVLGVLVIRERLSRAQWSAVWVTAFGVLVMAIAGGKPPWVSLCLAGSFAVYGLVKKQAPLPALIGLLIENAVLILPAAIFLTYWQAQGNSTFGADSYLTVFMLLGGCITIAPLALFAYAAPRVPLATIGILQFIGPTMQFIIGAFILAEPFDRWKLFGFSFVWIGLVVYLLDTTRQNQPASKTGENATGDKSAGNSVPAETTLVTSE